MRFTPHYLVWVCPASYHKSEECRSQCIRQGRYCTPDPDGDLAKGYSGADIVQVRPKPGTLFLLRSGALIILLHAQTDGDLTEGYSGADTVQGRPEP